MRPNSSLSVSYIKETHNRLLRISLLNDKKRSHDITVTHSLTCLPDARVSNWVIHRVHLVPDSLSLRVFSIGQLKSHGRYTTVIKIILIVNYNLFEFGAMKLTCALQMKGQPLLLGSCYPVGVTPFRSDLSIIQIICSFPLPDRSLLTLGKVISVLAGQSSQAIRSVSCSSRTVTLYSPGYLGRVWEVTLVPLW